ncbi:Coatomer subunit gamma-2 [Datura stramonium]|uniref:Coatomer subunit gamma-2 n=1 Tax=Datura stramonium TaxID=4076 RepID=A0ABS8T5L0_DATST|nr:Coatomer subunit gamma-2 [Datura stramonium]
MAYSFLSDLVTDRDDLMIRVRICRMWETINSKKDGELISLNMIFIDEKSDLVHAIVIKDHVNRFKNKLSEGEVSFSTTHASKIYFNLDVDYVRSLMQKFSTMSMGVQIIESSNVNSIPIEEEMFMNQMDIKNLLEFDWSPDIQSKIAEVANYFRWYYISCNMCSKKIEPANGVYQCPTAKKIASSLWRSPTGVWTGSPNGNGPGSNTIDQTAYIHFRSSHLHISDFYEQINLTSVCGLSSVYLCRAVSLSPAISALQDQLRENEIQATHYQLLVSLLAICGNHGRKRLSSYPLAFKSRRHERDKAEI